MQGSVPWSWRRRRNSSRTWDQDEYVFTRMRPVPLKIFSSRGKKHFYPWTALLYHHCADRLTAFTWDAYTCSWSVPFQDSQMVIEAFKSGFEPPGDVDFEDFTQPMKRTVSESSLSNSRGDGKYEPKFGGKSKGKLWPFIKKNKVLTCKHELGVS